VSIKPSSIVPAALKIAFADEISLMFENEELADFQLRTNDNEVLKAHKFILAARSKTAYKVKIEYLMNERIIKARD
jgi:hypothetical protein